MRPYQAVLILIVLVAQTYGTSIARKVSWDPVAVTVNGQRKLILSGSIHYPRSTPSMWDGLMKKTVEAGLNTIDTYVFWHLHEPVKGTFDWSGNLDLLQFLKTAQKYKLDVILRIGPYICAEINYGGFPAWLKEVEGIQFRTFNQPFMKEMGDWVSRVVEYVRPQLSINGGNVLLLQIENEYGDQIWAHGELGKKYIQWCIDFAEGLKAGVPWIMCQGSAGSALNTVNGFYGHEKLGKHWELYPDQPGVWTENWPGWFDFWNYNHNTRGTADVAYSVLRFFAMGGTGMNYYMWHGGTNFGRTPSYLVTTGYDYDAPLDEYGNPHDPKHAQLKSLHTFLNDNQEVFLQGNGTRPVPISLGDKLLAYEYSSDNKKFSLLCNDDDKYHQVTYKNKQFDLAGKSVVWVNNGVDVVYNTSNLPQRTTRQVFNRGPDLTDLKYTSEPNAPFQKLVVESTKPVESLQFTKDTTDYTWYVTTVTIKEAASELVMNRMGDIAHLFINDSYVSSSSFYLKGERGKYDSDGWKQSISIPSGLNAGTYKIAILTASVGLTKIEGEINGDNLADDKRGIWGKVTLGALDITVGKWQIQPGTVGEFLRVYADGYDKLYWSSEIKEAEDKPLKWFSLSFGAVKDDKPLVLDVSGLKKGIAWVNGICIGRYSNLPTKLGQRNELFMSPVLAEPSNGPTQRYYHIPKDFLSPSDHNRIVLFEELGGKADQVRLATVSYQTDP